MNPLFVKDLSLPKTLLKGQWEIVENLHFPQNIQNCSIYCCMEPKTIDDLGIEISQRYALDIAEYEKGYYDEAPRVSQQMQVDVTETYYPSHVDAMLGGDLKNHPFPDFYPPMNYTIQRQRTFTHQLLPSLGSDEMLETQIERIKSTVSTDEEGVKGKGWEQVANFDEEAKEAKTLVKFLHLIQSFDRILKEIHAGRNQYQRG